LLITRPSNSFQASGMRFLSLAGVALFYLTARFTPPREITLCRI